MSASRSQTTTNKNPYVHEPAVDVAKLLETEQTGAMGRVIEDERLSLQQLVSMANSLGEACTHGGSVDGNSTRVGRGIRLRTVQN